MRTLYRGDIVSLFPCTPTSPHWVIREVRPDRIKVQMGETWSWMMPDEVPDWDGHVATRLPRTWWGWRRLGKRIAEYALPQ